MNNNSTCRSCLQQNQYLHSIFQPFNNYMLDKIIQECTAIQVNEFFPKVFKKILKYFSSQINQSDVLPQEVCNICAIKLVEAYEIRNLFISSDQYLRNHFNFINNTNISTVDETKTKLVENSEENNEWKDNIVNNEFDYLNTFITEAQESDEKPDEDNICEEICDDDFSNNEDEDNKGEEILMTILKDDENVSEEKPSKKESVKKKSSIDDEFDEKILCKICKKTFPNQVSFRRHQNYHKSEKTKCPLCPKEFSHKSNLKRHLMTHKDKKPFDCDKCDQSYDTAANLYEHIKFHVNESPEKEKEFSYVMECEICNQKSSSYAVFANHMKTDHNIDKVKAFKCRVCDMTFASKQGMFRHIDNIHENNRRNLRNRDKNFLCNTCGKSFYTNFHLEVHIRSHTGIKPFKCPHCDKSFSQKSGLSMHVYTHTGEKPFACKVTNSLTKKNLN